MIFLCKKKSTNAICIISVLFLLFSGCNLNGDDVQETDDLLLLDGDFELYRISEMGELENPTNGLVLVEQSDSLQNSNQQGYIIGHYYGKDRDIVLPQFASDGTPIIGIGKWAFSGATDLQSVVIPDGYQYVFSNAFTGLKKLSSVYIGKSMEYISGGDVFMECDSLENIEVDNANPYYYSVDNCILHRETMRLIVGGCNSHIPDGTKIIGSTAFYSRSHHDSVLIPSTVEKIEAFAFGLCESTSFFIDENVTTVDSSAFVRCKNAKFFCESPQRPAEWDEYWLSNSENATIAWDFHKKE